MQEEEEVQGQSEDEEEREPITHCVHRLPFKGQKVNLELYYDVVQVSKVYSQEALLKRKKQGTSFVEPLKKIGFLASFFNKGAADTSAQAKLAAQESVAIRYLAFYEGRLLVVNSITE